MTPHIRWMIRADLPEVLAIENASFDPPWVEQDFLNALKQKNCIGMVAVHADAVLGYMIYELCKHELKLITLAVHPTWRRMRVGTAMVEKMKAKLSYTRRPVLSMILGERNLSAQLFMQACELKCTQIMKGWHEASGEDGYEMEHRIALDFGEDADRLIASIYEEELSQ